jgi:hypothetical protein
MVRAKEFFFERNIKVIFGKDFYFVSLLISGTPYLIMANFGDILNFGDIILNY